MSDGDAVAAAIAILNQRIAELTRSIQYVNSILEKAFGEDKDAGT